MGNPTEKSAVRAVEARDYRAERAGEESWAKEPLGDLPTADEVENRLDQITNDVSPETSFTAIRTQIRDVVKGAEEEYRHQGPMKLFQDPFSAESPAKILAKAQPVLTSSVEGLHAELRLEAAGHPSVMTDETFEARVVSSAAKGDGAIDLVLALKDRNGQVIPNEQFVVSKKEMEQLGLFKNGRLRENLDGLRLMVHQLGGSRGPTNAETTELMVSGYQDLGAEASRLLHLARETGANLGPVHHRLTRLVAKIDAFGDRAALLDPGDLENVRKTIELVKDAARIVGDGGKLPAWMRMELFQRVSFSEVPLHTAAGIQYALGVD